MGSVLLPYPFSFLFFSLKAGSSRLLEIAVVSVDSLSKISFLRSFSSVGYPNPFTMFFK